MKEAVYDQGEWEMKEMGRTATKAEELMRRDEDLERL